MSERFLANENFPLDIVTWLRNRGDDVVHAAESMSGAADEQVLAATRSENRVLLTFDRDFGELVFHKAHEPPRGIVLFRVLVHSRRMLHVLVESFFDSDPALDGFFTVVSPGHYRQTPLKL